MRPLIQLDVDAITENVERLRELSGVDLIGVVKAEAYGHGALKSARAMLAAGAVQIGVATIAEGLRLRAAGIDAPVLAWLHSADPDFAAAASADIDVAVSGVRQLEAAGAAGGIRVHLKFDTGLGRNGAPAAEWGALIDRATALQAAGRIRVAGIMSHLAGKSMADDDVQRARFSTALAATAELGAESSHICASDGMLGTVVGNRVRPGISCYGLHPHGTDATGEQARALGLRPALRLTAPAVDGMVPFGWQHGLLPATDAEVLVGDRRHRIIERGPTHVRLERPVSGTAVIIGDAERGEPTAGDWAVWSGTINYEVVTRLAPTIERRPL